MQILCRLDTSAGVMGPGGILGELVPNLGAIVPLVLAPHLVIVGESFDWGIVDGEFLQSTMAMA